MRTPQLITFSLALSLVYCGDIPAQINNDRLASPQRPVILGHGVGLFKIGRLLAHDNFDTLEDWCVQIQDRSGFAPPKVETRHQSLDCWMPGRGCTIWFKKKLSTRVTIMYDVICPSHQPAIPGVEPRDNNNFWMASASDTPHDDLFDTSRYNGAFKSYDRIRGYYASTGGGRANDANRTTRMRRYPRGTDGNTVEHMALTSQDGKAAYRITPDKVMSVQLVAYHDVVQYIVDGKLVYQIGRGDRVHVETPNDEGRPVRRDASYELDRFPVYDEGYFGFRMVGTHHVYKNFRVYRLDPDMTAGAQRRPTVRVASLDALRQAISNSNQQIILQPGKYQVTDAEGFHCSGSNNDINLADAFIEVPMRDASGSTLFRLTGDHITLRGGTLEDTYPDGTTTVADFGAYNQGRKWGGMNEIEVTGNDNRVVGIKLTIRGSYPYGYGNMFGIGRGNALGRLRKHCGIQVTGDRAIIDGCDIKMQAFGHVIYVQGGDRTTVRNTYIEGTLRSSNDCYRETNQGDLAKRFNYQLQWPEEVKGLPIPRDHMLNCTEDGIRAYRGAGDMIVENCVVKKCRGGIKLYMAKSARVSNCKVLDCVVQGYSLPSRGVIANSVGNAAYGPLLYVHFDTHSNQVIDLKVLPAPHGIGDHPLAAIKGTGHQIKFRNGGDQTIETPRPIIVGYSLRFDFLSLDYPNVPKGLEERYERYSPGKYRAVGINIDNRTRHPVVLGKLSDRNKIVSVGPIRDLGTDNTSTQRH